MLVEKEKIVEEEEEEEERSGVSVIVNELTELNWPERRIGDKKKELVNQLH